MTRGTLRIEDLSPAKRELLRRRLEKLRGETPPPAAGAPEPRPEILPLSFSQERLWFLEQLEPGQAAYHLSATHRLRGTVDEILLERALAEVVRRHESLRTTFPAVDGQPRQHVAAELRPRLAVLDLRSLPPAARTAEARRLIAGLARRPFDLARGPLLRSAVLRLAERERVLAMVLHHLVTDGWSMRVLVGELTAAYHALAAGRPAALPELGWQYADFAAAQRRRLSGEALAGHLGYWKRQLAGIPEALDLPADRPRPAVASHRGGHRSTVLAGERAERLKALAKRQGKTPFMVLLAVLDTLLHRLSGQTDVVVGTPMANRDQLESERLIGFFVNTLVLRVRLDGRLTFEELLERVRETVLDAHAHQDLPFEKLVEELQPERSLSRTPLFQVLFAYQNIPGRPADGGGGGAGLEIEPFPVEHGSAQFDLGLSVEETPGRLAATFEYSSDLFDATRVERWCRQFLTLLDAAVADPRRRLDRLPILSAGERHQLVAEWNDTATPDGAAADTLGELLAAQARRTPESVAVVYERSDEPRRRLTYRQLDERATELARHLRRLGVGPETMVGIALERSPEMVVALVAVVAAGGAYVPIDPDYPRDRQTFMLADSRVPVLLTTRRLHAALAPSELERDGLTVVFLDEAEPASQTGGTAAPDGPAAPHAGGLAYTIYTSGSTGRPKGAMNTHGAIVNRLRWMQSAYHLAAGDRVLQKTPFSFDVSVWELFWPLLTGARLVLARPGGHREPAYLVDLIVREAVTTLHFVPSMLQAFVEHDGVERCRGVLRRVIASGEALPAGLARRFHERLAGVALHNLYGPTEAAVDVTSWACVPAPADGPVPIGRPIANTAIHLLDRRLQTVPIGVAGELHIAGAGLARGYFGRPGLTAEKFLPDPVGELPGGRAYRTGDLARHRAGGEIEFLGRLDHQVKIRGFRIELGEIEAALAARDGVREAVVLLTADGRLVAHAVAAGGETPAAAELRAALAAGLPDYMLPAAFVFHPSLPLLPNGKVDRGALTAASLPAPAGGARVAPRDPVEEILADLWAELLGVERVGVHDHFFHLGGHSLLATRMISQLRRRLGVELELRELFEAPTLEALARRVERTRRSGGAPTPAIAPRAEQGPASLSFGQERLWFLDQLDPGTPAYNLPTAIRLRGPLERDALAAALSAVVARHQALRTTFVLADGEPVQRIGEAYPVPLPELDLEPLGERRWPEARRLLTAAARHPFDLASGPLLRAALLRLGREDRVLVLVLHHIVSDGWSLGVLTRELVALYDAAAGGATAGELAATLPPLPVQYADFATWQRRWLSGEVLAAQLDAWRRRLGTGSSVLELPADRPRPPVQTFRGDRRLRPLPAGAAKSVRELARDAGVTPFMALLAIAQILLHRLTGERSITVGTPVANRRRAEVQDLIGFFVNTLVLRTDLGRGGEPHAPSARQILARVREVTLAAYDHQDLPFEKLVEELEPERNLSHTPLFQVFFQLLGPVHPWQGDGGLRFEELPVELGAAKFDLTLALQENGDELTAAAEYNTDLFDRTTIERLLGHLATLAAAVLADPDRPISALELLTAAETRQLVVEWNDTEPPPAPAATLVDLFEAQVDRTPDAPAVVLDAGGRDAGATWRELDRRANRLARHLQELGVGPEQLVGILTERSLDLVTGILATLKAGAAYLPLDPAYPAERLAFMLRDAAAPVVLTQQRFADRVDARDARVLSLDVLGPTLAAYAGERLPCPAHERHLAYAIYTSGSTGKPKGVAIEHRSAVAMLRWARDAFAAGERAGMLASTSICFDLSVFELFLPLCSGGRLILADNALHLPSHAAAGEVTLINTVPSAIAELLAGGGLPAAVGIVNLAGEPLRRDLVEALYELPQVRAVCNLYGPSEDTTYSTWTRVEPGVATPPSIGRPVAGSRCYVADAGLRPLPVGVPGELYLAGAGLARGYHDRPALTAERFVPDPFSRRPGERLYRTGDLVRYRAGARLDFLGRADHQIKLRGFRIELGEIEAVLRRHPAIADAAAEVRPAGGEPRLVAYTVAAGGEAPAGDELRAFLRETLPPHMVPAVFVPLDALPLTANGKVDRKALPDPEGLGERRTAEYQEPQSATERHVARVWREVLRVEKVGLHDNFFDLGGHSLLMVRAYHKLRESFGDLGFPLVKVFAYPTVSSLARFLDQGEEETAASRERGRDRGSLRRQAQERRRRGPRERTRRQRP